MSKRKWIIFGVAAGLALVLLIVYLAVLRPLFNEEQPEEGRTPVALEPGEAYLHYGNTELSHIAVVFPQLEREDLFQISVHNKDGEDYLFYHYQTGGKNYFMIGTQEAAGGEVTFYHPPVADLVSDFDYTSLYDDTTTIPTMINAVGTLTIGERVYKWTNDMSGDEIRDQLHRFGLAEEDDPAYFELTAYLRDANDSYVYLTVDTSEEPRYVFTDANGKDAKYYYAEGVSYSPETGYTYDPAYEYEGDRTTLTPAPDNENHIRVYVGKSTIDGNGYYVRLDGRKTVYSITGTYLADVMERDVGYYIAPRLVIQAENAYAPQLTPQMTEWVGTYNDTVGSSVTDEMTVAYTAVRVLQSGVPLSSAQKGTFDLFSDDMDERIKSALIGKKVGDTLDLFTLVTRPFEKGPGQSRTYEIVSAVGVWRNGEYLTEGTVAAGDIVAVRFYDTDHVTGPSGGEMLYYGAVDLTSHDTPTALAALVTGMEIGVTYDRSERVYTAQYGTDTEEMYHIRYALEQIAFVNEGTSDGKITYNSYVNLTYRHFEEGEDYGAQTVTFLIPKEEEFETLPYIQRTFYSMLLGLGVGKYVDDEGNSTKAADIYLPREVITDYLLIDDAHIDYTTKYEMKLSIAYSNDIPAYYGSSLYTILAPDGLTLYGLDYQAGEDVLRRFEDLIGNETVAIGLTQENMEEYGLFAHRLYYEMPFGIDQAANDDFLYEYAVPFNLYISDLLPDGSRYVGCDLYNTVVHVTDGSIFDFLDWDFYDDWARKNLVLMDYSQIESITITTNFSDWKQKYGFALSIDPAYTRPVIGSDGKPTGSQTAPTERLYVSLVTGADIEYKHYWDHSMATKPSAGISVQQGANSQYITEVTNGVDLDKVYFDAGKTEVYHGNNYGGVTNFTRFLRMLYVTYYGGNVEDDLTEEEIAELKADPDACVMTFRLVVRGETGAYVFRFYAYSLHTMVSITEEDADGNTVAVNETFYVMTRDVRRIASALQDMVAGKDIDTTSY